MREARRDGRRKSYTQYLRRWVRSAIRFKLSIASYLQLITQQYAEIMYGLKAEQDVVGVDRDQDDSEDIESLVEKELQSIEARGSGGSRKVTFTAVQLDIGCLFFMKTRDPIRPVDLVRRICQDAKTGMDAMAKKKTRYLNRLTPSTLIGKASESGVVDLARMVLTPWFDLSGKRGKHVPGDAVASNEESTNVADGKDDRTRGEEKRDASTRESEGGRPESYSVSYCGEKTHTPLPNSAF